jgi:hypothetical protein
MARASSAVLTGILLALAAGSAAAQEDPAAAKKARQQAAYREALEAKQRESWFKDFGWTADYDRARERAKAEKKLIIAYFLRSYAKTPACEGMEGRVLSSEAFRPFSKDHVLFAHIASMVDGEKYPDLLKEKGGSHLPYVAALDSGGEMLYPLEEMSIAGFQSMVKLGAEDLALRQKKARTPGEEMRFLVLENGAGRVADADVRAKAQALKGLDANGTRERDDLLIRIEVAAEMARFKKEELAKHDPKNAVDSGRLYAAMYRAGRIPKDYGQASAFYGAILDFAEAEKDPALFEAAHKGLKDVCKDKMPLPDFYLKQLDERLARIKAAAAEKKDGGGGEKK